MKKSFARVPLFFIILVWLIFLLIPAQTVILAQEVDYSEDFEDGQAQGWNLEEGWQVIDDGGNQVLAGEGHYWASSDRSYDDYQLTFRLKLIKGSIHLVYRRNAEGRYFIGFTPSGSYLSKQYWPDDFRENLVKKTAKYSASNWHQVEIIGQGNQLTFRVDGSTEWTYTDPEPLEYGDFAFETLENSQAYIDDIVLTVSEAAPAPAAAAESAAEQPPASPTQVIKKAAETVPAGELTWVRTGGPLGGLGYDVRMSPDNPDKMFVTDGFAGIFKSLDGGKNWLPFNSGVNVRFGSTNDATPVFSVTIDPSQPDIIWIGTQHNLGIFKSTDSGETWKKMVKGISENVGISFRGFTVDPNDSDTVYATAEISSWEGGKSERKGRGFDMTRGVVYKTTNGGKNWKAIWRGENLARYVWIDPRDTDVLYLSTGIFDREAYNSDPETGEPGGEGILKSIDGGLTWQYINNGLKNLYVGSLFMHPSNPDILLAGTGNNAYYENGGIYLTTNGGANWLQVLDNDNITAVEFALSDPSIAYAGSTNFVYRSEDEGHTWQLVSGSREVSWGTPNIMGGFPIDFQVDPRDPDRFFINAYGGGNFLTEDGGKTWVDASHGYTGAIMRGIAIDPSQPAHIFAVARSGIFTSYDGGENWEGLNYPPVFLLEWTAVAIDPDNPQHIIAGSDMNNPLVVSLDGGYSWEVREWLEESTIGLRWGDIVFAPSEPKIIYAGTTGFFLPGYYDFPEQGKGVYISRDGGLNWQYANDSLNQGASVVSLAVDPHDSKVVYAATTNQGLIKTKDAGTSWESLDTNLSSMRATVVAINPDNSNILFAGFDRSALIISTNSGQTWKRSASGIPPEASISSIVFDPTDPSNIIYAADVFSGVYRSTDGGKKWKQINNGLLNRAVQRLAISADGQHLYAATEGSGVFRLDLNGQPPAEAPRPKLTAPTQSAPANANDPAQASQTGNTDPESASGTGSWLTYALAGALLAVVVILVAVIKRKSKKTGG